MLALAKSWNTIHEIGVKVSISACVYLYHQDTGSSGCFDPPSMPMGKRNVNFKMIWSCLGLFLGGSLVIGGYGLCFRCLCILVPSSFTP